MSVDIEQLAHDHKRAIHTTDGIEFHTVPSLLTQLRQAIHGNIPSDGATGAMKSKLPFQAAALDLYMRLELEILTAYREQYPTQIPGADHPERYLALWAAKVTPDTIVNTGRGTAHAGDVVAGWVRAVDDYFNPPRLAEIQAACPTCNERWFHRHVDSERVRTSALVFRRDRDTGETLDARCQSCNTSWLPGQFRFLAELIGKEQNNGPIVTTM